MIKRSPSRNHRSKGIKVKHVLQICLLLGVCFWLIYQVKHSHDKKKEFDEKDAKLSVKTQSGGELLKFGRKDLHPRLEIVPEIEKHVEEEEEETGGGEEEENKHDEEEREEEENKHEEKEEDEEDSKLEVEEQEEEENKSEETEEDERGAGDDEIDENDQEKSDGDADHDEELVDEEKEGEEEDKESESNESDNNKSQLQTSLEDRGRDRGNHNLHEAREEHYKGDDASSAVTHNAQTIISEADKLSSGNSIEISKMNILDQENKSNGSQETGTDKNNPAIKVVEGEIDNNGTSLNAITIERKGNNGSSNSVDSLVKNSTMTAQSTDQPEASNVTTLVSKEIGNNSDEVYVNKNNATDTGIGTVNVDKNNATDIGIGASGFSQQNGTVNVSDSARAQNITVDLLSVRALEMEQNGNSTSISESNQSDVNSTVSIKIENADAGARESSTSSNTTEFALLEKNTTETEVGSVSSALKENIDATKNKVDGKNELDRTNKSSGNSTREEVPDAVEHNPVDASDSHIALDEKLRRDLDKMPDIRTGGENSKVVDAE